MPGEQQARRVRPFVPSADETQVLPFVDPADETQVLPPVDPADVTQVLPTVPPAPPPSAARHGNQAGAEPAEQDDDIWYPSAASYYPEVPVEQTLSLADELLGPRPGWTGQQQPADDADSSESHGEGGGHRGEGR